LFNKFNSFQERHPEVNEELTYEEIHRRLAEFREARAKATDVFGSKTYEDVWDQGSIAPTQEEKDLLKQLKRFKNRGEK
jgi:hypothetical protein